MDNFEGPFDAALELVPGKWVPAASPVEWAVGNVCPASGDMFFGTPDSLWKFQIRRNRVQALLVGDYKIGSRRLVHLTAPTADLHLRVYKEPELSELVHEWTVSDRGHATNPVMMPSVPASDAYLWRMSGTSGPHPTGDAAGSLYMVYPEKNTLVRARRTGARSVTLDSLAVFHPYSPTSMAVSADGRWIAVATSEFLVVADLATHRVDCPLAWTALFRIPDSERQISLTSISFAPSGDIVFASWHPRGYRVNPVIVIRPNGEMTQVQLPFVLENPRRGIPVCAAGDAEGRLWLAYAGHPLYVMADAVSFPEYFGPANAARFPAAFKLLVASLLSANAADARIPASDLFNATRSMHRIVLVRLLVAIQRAHGVWPEQTSYAPAKGAGVDDRDSVHRLVFGDDPEPRVLFGDTELMRDSDPATDWDAI